MTNNCIRRIFFFPRQKKKKAPDRRLYPQGLTLQEQVYYIIIDIVPDLEMIHCFIATILFRISQSDHSHQVITKTGKICMLATYTIQVVAW